jgi:ribosomal protein S18 acetylase RimI-like enzyme
LGNEKEEPSKRQVQIYRYHSEKHMHAYRLIYYVGYYHSLYREWLFQPKLSQEKPTTDECLIAFINNKPVGLIAFDINHETSELDVLEFVVLPEFRKIGIGRALMEKAEIIAQKNDLSEICVTIPYGYFENDPRLKELFLIYRKLGFKFSGISAWIKCSKPINRLVHVYEKKDKWLYIDEKDLEKLREKRITFEEICRNYEFVKKLKG